MNQAARKSPSHKRRKAAGIAVLVSVVVHVLLAFLVYLWVSRADEERDDEVAEPTHQEEEQLAEVLFEDEEPDASDVADDASQPLPNEQVEQAPADDSEPSTVQTEPEEQPEPEETPVPEERPPEPPVSQQQRQAVAQPTSNEELPETEEYFWSDVDNRAEQQTQAENPVQWTDDSASRTEREATQEEAEPRTSSRESASEERSERPNESEDRQGDDEQSERQQGGDIRSRAQASEEGARPSDSEQTEATRDERDEGERVPQTEQGEVDVGERGFSSLDEFSVERRTREAFESGAGAGETGAGSGSVSRRGAIEAESSFEQLYGEETAEGAENLRQQRREQSLAGDHQGDWERTREALANYDIAVETGTETHLNTRRNEHASFIHGYHNQLHPRWWDFLRMLNLSRSSRHQVDDMELETRVEIEVLADGSVEKVRIIRGSGNTYFDAEAVRIQYDIDEVPPPPGAIVCDDGSVYLHWTLSRAPGRCGTFHASVHCPSGS